MRRHVPTAGPTVGSEPLMDPPTCIGDSDRTLRQTNVGVPSCVGVSIGTSDGPSDAQSLPGRRSPERCRSNRRRLRRTLRPRSFRLSESSTASEYSDSHSGMSNSSPVGVQCSVGASHHCVGAFRHTYSTMFTLGFLWLWVFEELENLTHSHMHS